ncbi:MAG: acetyl-CoA carboxylase biotin carboxylase subunit [Pseudomonadales bacterium]|nr:acetyl-CoA carboxylase biotin carboxylase subunit [Pseudomonadales bacterium]
MKIQKLLIANRGEIACRVMRTARDMGIRTVAVYSEADADAVHTKLADEAVNIGPAPVSESYLAAERIIEAARQTGADAIHPGYGFLSENAAFAAACEQAGIVFIGPSSEAIDLMGDKARAKRAMIEAAVPCIPGYQDEDQSLETLVSAAANIGYPLMIKAAAGGGGRGMRLVDSDSELETAIDAARSEAINAFGSGELILEKAITRPRHVEVQVFGDTQGNIVYLGERDCSVQRRHQKVIEEAPCPVMIPELRKVMGEAAVAAARTVNYVGAGTVEFLLGEDMGFYFLEMNTRLQVEHPVTEEITGLDLVALQLKVASGEALGFTQDDVELNGHAIEIRLYAEDPANDFLPSTGKIEAWVEPSGPGIRVDGGIAAGGEVSPFYDPMLAKVIAYGRDREQARNRLIDALSGSALVGPATNRDFLIDALKRDEFARGNATTSFIADEYGEAGYNAAPGQMDLALAAVTQYRVRAGSALAESIGINSELLNWSSAAPLESVFIYRIDDSEHILNVHPISADTYRVTELDKTLCDITVLGESEQTLQVKINHEKQLLIFHAIDGKTLTIATPDIQFTVQDIAAGEALDDAAGDGMVTAPMHGQLLAVLVSKGDEVTKGQRLAVLEAMKMQHEILAEADGTVKDVHVEANNQVALDTLIMEIES